MGEESEVTRRQLLKTGLAAAGAAGLAASGLAGINLAASASAAAPAGERKVGGGLGAARGARVRWARLEFAADGWHVNFEADLGVVNRIRQATDVNMSFDFGVAQMRDLDRMCEYPFIFMHGQAPDYPRLDRVCRGNIREYLRRGGFMFIEDCVNSPADGFYQFMRREMPRILPGARYEDLAKDPNHEVFRRPYKVPAWPHSQGIDHGLVAVYDRDRLAAMMSASDIHCAWAGYGSPLLQETAVQMAVNIYVYAMTH
jgi:hypothetical protein